MWLWASVDVHATTQNLPLKMFVDESITIIIINMHPADKIELN